MPKNTKPKTATCMCGCGEPANRNYRPGHDARHVSSLVQAIADGLDQQAALKALPSDALRGKLNRAVSKKAA